MKNPLLKRLPKELKTDLGKYLVIFLFMTLTIGFVSGFLVAGSSMSAAYDESFEKYNIEDGNFTLSSKASKAQLERLEKEGVRIEESFFVEEDADADSDGKADGTMRIYKNRTGMNLICVMKGGLPEAEDEIAIDRMYADNNHLSVGDSMKIADKDMKITGLVALSDYSCLFSDNSDMMFDAVKFGVAIMTDHGFDSLGTTHLSYRYSWQYDKAPKNETEEKNMSEDFMKVLARNVSLTDYIPQYSNQAIHFAGDDIGGDQTMMEVLLYILIVIMAFVFAVTTNNTITKEASVIGTLRASGYTRGELLRHYIALPILVTLAAAVIGNILGYTYLKDICADMYYGSYSLPTYVTRWNGKAFVLTTVVPIVLMLVINIVLIYRKLTLSPLKFLRRDLGRSKKKKAVRLPAFSFMNRFRIRIILQNKSGYITLFIGILFANILLLFGMMMTPLLSNYQKKIVDNMIAKYQYMLNVPEDEEEEEEETNSEENKLTLMGVLQKILTPSLETKTEGAEKFCVYSLKNMPKNRDGESITIYGIQDDSQYVDLDFKDEGVYLSDGLAEKYNIHIGDELTLKEPYADDTYTFQVAGTYDYPAALAVFMPIQEYRGNFDKSEDYFNGYFSDEEIKDIDERYIATTITEDDLTKVSRQLTVSMGSMFYLVNMFAVILFAILIYLLTKLIIEKNSASISMVKILGYENKEIISLYFTSTTWVVIFSIILSLAAASWIMTAIYKVIMMDFSGWLTLYLDPVIYPEMVAMGLGVYGFVAAMQYRKIKKIPMDQALKNVE